MRVPRIALFAAAFLLAGAGVLWAALTLRAPGSNAAHFAAPHRANASAGTVPAAAYDWSGPDVEVLPASPPSGCTRSLPADVRPGATVQRKLRTGLSERDYRLRVPASATQTDRLPLVLSFHGRGSDAREHESYAGFAAVAERARFILVTPNGTGTPRGWDAGATPPGHADDIAFATDLIATLKADLCVDDARVYAVGFSNGSFMAARVGCALGKEVAAIAGVAGAHRPAGECSRAMPVLAIHGTADTIVPFERGSIRGTYPYGGARSEMGGWSVANHCSGAAPAERVSAKVTRESYRGCEAPVVLYVVQGGGHTWPGASEIPALGTTTREINAAETVWAFFAAQTLPRP